MAKNYIIKEKLENGQFETLHPETNAGNVLVTNDHHLDNIPEDTNLQAMLNAIALRLIKDSSIVTISDLSELDTYMTPGIYRFKLNTGDSAFHLFVTSGAGGSTGAYTQIRTSATGYYKRDNYKQPTGSWSSWIKSTYNVNGTAYGEVGVSYTKGAIITYGNSTCMALEHNVTVSDISDDTKWFKLSDVPTTLAAKMDTATANSTFVPLTQRGAANGIATLDTAGKVPASQLPSYVDDIEEYDTLADFPTTGETGKIYVDIKTNKTYRWGGSKSGYVEISASLALGDTDSTAYPGIQGKANAEAIKTLQDTIDILEGIVGGEGAGSLSELVERVAEVENVNNTQNTEIANIKNGTTKVGKSTTADKFATAQTITVKGDIAGSVSFDGSTAKELTLTLPNTNVIAGTYSAVSVNAKGQVTAGAYMIEVGAEGATAPTSNLAVGGIFFQHKA
jgi:hypothetical protein